MPQFREDRNQMNNAFAWSVAPAVANPMMAILADMNGTVLEGFATAHKDWADFAQRRTREDVAVARQLLSCHSLPDMYQIYSRYLQTAFEQYREQSERFAQRSQNITQHLTETAEANATEVARARH